ncbi:unnamed protein product, partial [Symbiodinium sp. KB8]
AHHKAIGSISGPNGVTSRADWDEVNAALGRVVASVPKAKVMAVYDAVKDITDPKVPAYMKSLVNGPDAEKAYQGFLEFKDVVAKNQVTAASAPAVVPSGDKIGDTVMDVYNSMAKIVDPTVTNNMFSKVNPLDAVAAAKGFYTFKDVVQ